MPTRVLTAIAVIVFSMPISAGLAQEESRTIPASYNAPASSDIESLRAEVAELRSLVNDGIGDSFESCPYWYVGLEIPFLQPHIGSGAIDGTPLAPTFGYEPSVRLLLGRVNENGLGVRLRYWDFDADAEGTIENIFSDEDGLFNVRARTVDLEVTMAGQIHNWEMEVAGGIRYGKNGLQVLWDGGDVLTDRMFEGFGPTVALEVRRPVGCSGWSLVGNGRFSLLFGDLGMALDPDDNFVLPDVYVSQEKTAAQVIEVAIGAEKEWDARNGTMVARLMLEGQHWDVGRGELAGLISNVLGANVGDPMGMTGVTFTLTYLR